MEFSAITDQGLLRDNNEDAWYADGDSALFVVSDGVGGALAGEVASGIVCQALPILLEDTFKEIDTLTVKEAPQRLEDALIELNRVVYEVSCNQEECTGMGATVVAAFICNDHFVWGHLGDSRIYLLRGEEFIQLTIDHSVVQFLIDCKEITEEQAQGHPASGQITQYVGMPFEADPDIACLPIHVGDKLLLCSDGLTDMVPADKVGQILKEATDTEKCCEKLVQQALRGGGRDNVTVLTLFV